ncbi:hypothetical protein AMAG_06452 [Allomyces macrogynus ATCC 38327]|uniref:Uncharacterized protein n=1 Tax=Allomyces macrogynus (strain ATCC 38327) TaxID=578462 RepID=A0A0L0SGJ9_ALLM3|nr:hypothetical protein AMAG_06452 [Allomyces macrogynus ATCC 38327]|eukprot:KNE61641.1 hypothetical protein AMAG_06452 [Allomyces macrogynus ATCC 38327]
MLLPNGDRLAHLASTFPSNAYATTISDPGFNIHQTQYLDHQAHLDHQMQLTDSYYDCHVLVAMAGASASTSGALSTNAIMTSGATDAATTSTMTPVETDNMNPPMVVTATTGMMPPMGTTTAAGLIPPMASITPANTVPPMLLMATAINNLAGRTKMTTSMMSLSGTKSDMPKTGAFVKSIGAHKHLAAEFWHPPMNVDDHLQAVSLLMEIAAASDTSVMDQSKKAALVYLVEKSMWPLLVSIPEWKVGTYAEFAARVLLS